MQTNAVTESAADKEMSTRIELQQVELDIACETIAQLRAEAQAAEAKARTTVSAPPLTAAATNVHNASPPSPSIQDIKTSQAYGELLTTKDVQGNQLDKALKIIVRLRKDVDIERKKTTQALSERHAIQTDLDKFRAMQRDVSAERSHPRLPVKPWYKFW